MSLFDDEQNPFDDPSIRTATQPKPGAPATIDFNPFDMPTTTTISARSNLNAQAPPQWPVNQAGFESAGGNSGTSSVMREEAPPAYAGSAAEKISTDELERRQRELELKAAEIQRREDELARQSMPIGTVNNWPPLPAWCPLKPCYYQDFDVDIAEQYRLMVRFGYYAAIAHIVDYALNVIIGFAYFMVTISASSCSNNQLCSSAGTTFGLSILWFLIFSPAAYVCWFRPLYKAFKTDSSINFFWFFIVTMAQFVVDIVWALGFAGSGSLGLINGLGMISINVGIGITMVVMGGLSATLAVADATLLIRVHRVYRSTGASFEKAKQELARGAFSNEVVRGAVVTGVQSTVAGTSSAASGSTTSQNSSGVVRF